MNKLDDRRGLLDHVYGPGPLVREFTLTPLNHHLLASNVEWFYEASCAYPLKNFMTPNGALKPKMETSHIYEAFFAVLGLALFYPLKLEEHFSYASLPVIRLVTGTETLESFERPYATSKLHSEFWVGQTFDLNVIIPLSGDAAHTRVEFFEPLTIKAGFETVKADYADGLSFCGGLSKIPVEFQCGSIYVQDNYVLHRTVRGGGRARFSVDFGLLYKGREPGAHNPETIYLPMEKWLAADLSGVTFPSINDENFRLQ